MKTITPKLLNRLAASLLLVIALPAGANTDPDEDYQVCLVQALKDAADTDTVGDVRERCKVESAARQLAQSSVPELRLIERRMFLEEQATENRFAILQHKPSYILPLSYMSEPNDEPFNDAGFVGDLDNTEVKFQFSFKAQLLDAILHDRGKLYFGYTNQSYWQLYNVDNSGPFRETNHEPELFLDMTHDATLWGWHIPLARYGFVHQSNGRSEPLSRSWNRAYGQVFFEKLNWAFSLKGWVRTGGDTAESDNPEIDDYMGNFELGIYRQGNNSAASLRLRNNLQSDNKGAVEFNWSYPLPYNKKLRFLFQYFYGYGESLIDYDERIERVGIGLQLSDFL